MDNNTKKLIKQLQTEGIGMNVAGMHRGIDLLKMLAEADSEVAFNYFKGVAAACEHISGKMLGETNNVNQIKNESTIIPKPAKNATFVDSMNKGSALDKMNFLMDEMENVSVTQIANAPKSATGAAFVNDLQGANSKAAAFADDLF